MTTTTRTRTPRTDDPYTRMLDDLRARQRTLSRAVKDAHLCTGPIGRRATLAELHTQIRGMAALVNDALGGWPEPESDPQ